MAARLATRRWISPRPSEQSPIDIALRFLAGRPRSEREVRTRLRRAGVDEAATDAALLQLKTHHLVDDDEFARYWVEQRQTFRPRGARLLRAELAQRGVSRAAADAASAELTPEDDAYRAALKHAVRLRALDERTFQSRLGQWLARRGFDWGTITPVVDRLWGELSRS